MTCTFCTAEITNGVALCTRCQQTLVTACVNVAAYYVDVDRIKPGQRVKVRGAYKSTPPPGTESSHDPISEAIDFAAVIVAGWSRNLTDDRPGIGQIPRTVPTACGWLERHVPTIATLEWAGECLREMLDCERMLRRIIDRADTGWYAGVCENEIGREWIGEGDDSEVVAVLCERHLYGTVGTAWVRCPECGRTWDAGERRKALLREARGELAPVSVIARAAVGLLDAEVSVQRLANRIDQWVSRGRLQSLGVRVLTDGKPHRVYRLGDVFDMLGVEVQPPAEEAC